MVAFNACVMFSLVKLRDYDVISCLCVLVVSNKNKYSALCPETVQVLSVAVFQ